MDAALIPAGTTTAAVAAVPNVGRPAKSILLILDVTAVSSGTVTLTVNGVSASGYVYPILAGAAVSATGVTVYRIGLGFTPAANLTANDQPPQQVQVAAAKTGTVTYGVDVSIVQ